MTLNDGRFGTAGFAERGDFSRAGLCRRSSDAVLLGFDRGRSLFFGGQAGILTVAGARAGKGGVLGYTLCGASYDHNIVALDPKNSELAAISQNQTHTNRHIVRWAPYDGGDRINPLGHFKKDCPMLISNIKLFLENALPRSGSANSQYFELRAREVGEGLFIPIIEKRGELTFKLLYYAINAAIAGGEGWLDQAFDMHDSQYPLPRRVEQEIFQSHQNDSGSGFRGILSELSKAFACLSDPVLMESLSGPFTWSLDELLDSQKKHIFFLNPPIDFLETWGAIIRVFFSSICSIKAQNPQSPKMLFIVDEAGSLCSPGSGGFPALVRLYTTGAGMNLKPWTIIQSLNQLDQLGPGAREQILSSAGVQQYFGVRDEITASFLSRMCGRATISVDDSLPQAQAAHAKRMALHSMMHGADAFQAMAAYRQARYEETHQSLMARDLITPSEILSMPRDRQLIFCDQVSGPMLVERRAYFEDRKMAGLFHPNPWHPPQDQVRVPTRFGMQWRRVIEEPVPARYAHLRQYQNTGRWSYVEGFRPPC